MKKKIKMFTPYMKFSKREKNIVRYVDSKTGNTKFSRDDFLEVYSKVQKVEDLLFMAECVTYYTKTHQFKLTKREASMIEKTLTKPLNVKFDAVSAIYNKWAHPMESVHQLYRLYAKKHKPVRLTPNVKSNSSKSVKRLVGYNLFIQQQWKDSTDVLQAMVKNHGAKHVMNHLSKLWKSDPLMQEQYNLSAKTKNQMAEAKSDDNGEASAVDDNGEASAVDDSGEASAVDDNGEASAVDDNAMGAESVAE